MADAERHRQGRRGRAGVVHVSLGPSTPAKSTSRVLSSVSLFDQRLLQVLQVSAVGLEPRRPYVLAFARKPDGTGALEALSSFNTNPAGAAIVNAVGPIRQLATGAAGAMRRYLVIVPGTPAAHGAPVQLGVDENTPD